MGMFGASHWMKKMLDRGLSKLNSNNKVVVHVCKPTGHMYYSGSDDFCADMFDLSISGLYMSNVIVTKWSSTYEIEIVVKKCSASCGFKTNISAEFMEFVGNLLNTNGLVPINTNGVAHR